MFFNILGQTSSCLPLGFSKTFSSGGVDAWGQLFSSLLTIRSDNCFHPYPAVLCSPVGFLGLCCLGQGGGGEIWCCCQQLQWVVGDWASIVTQCVYMEIVGVSDSLRQVQILNWGSGRLLVTRWQTVSVCQQCCYFPATDTLNLCCLRSQTVTDGSKLQLPTVGDGRKTNLILFWLLSDACHRLLQTVVAVGWYHGWCHEKSVAILDLPKKSCQWQQSMQTVQDRLTPCHRYFATWSATFQDTLWLKKLQDVASCLLSVGWE